MRNIYLIFSLLLVLVTSSFADNHAASDVNPHYYKFGAGALLFEMDEEYKSGQTYEIRRGYDLCDTCSLEYGITGGPFFEGPDLARFTGEKAAGGENWSLGANVALLHHLNGNPRYSNDDPTGQWDPYVGPVAGAFWYKKSTNHGHWDPYLGVEVGTNYFLSDKWSVGGDYRVLVVGENTEINHQVMFTLGYYWDKDDSSGGSRNSGFGTGEGGLQTVYFEFDKSNLSQEARSRLDKNAEWLLDNEDEEVILEGHCDERGTNEYNLALGSRRAQSVYEYLLAKGVPAKQMSTISYGEEDPADPASNATAWSKNRRVECSIK